MTSATLYREGSDLDLLLADLDSEFPGRVRVVEVTHPREGGFLGFFARQRVGVHYRLLDESAASAMGVAAPRDGAAGERAASDGVASDDAASDAALSDAGSPATPAGAEFARLVAELLSQRAADRGASPSTVDEVADRAATGTATTALADEPEPFWAKPNATSGAAPADSETTSLTAIGASPAPTATVRPAVNDRSSLLRALQSASAAVTTEPSGPDADAPAISSAMFASIAVARPEPPPWAGSSHQPTAWSPPVVSRDGSPIAGPSVEVTIPVAPQHSPDHLTLRRRLVEAGVPVDRVPADATHLYHAAEKLVATLPPAPAAPLGNAGVLVIAGSARELTDVLDSLRPALCGRAAQVVAYRFLTTPSDLGAEVSAIDTAEQARAFVTAARAAAAGPTVALVATDRPGLWDADPREVIAALAPDAVWAVVDATRKPADTRRSLDRIGQVDALIVQHAAESSSPATVWDLGLPIAVVDGERSDAAAWTVLLLRSMTSTSQGQACSDDLF